MLKIGLLLTLLVTQSRQFQVVGEVVSPANRQFQRVEIESIDHRFVDYTNVDFEGRFVFKKIPEGLYKLTISGKRTLQEQRTIEVRPEFADSRGRVAVKVQLGYGGPPKDQFKVGVTALGISPKAAEELRRAYDARGDIRKVREHLHKAIDLSPNFEEALNNLGTIYYADHQFQRAAELFERALEANPDSFSARVNLGGTLISLGKYEHALTENLKALEIRPADSLAQSQTGQTLFHLRRYDDALAHLELAKQIDPMSFTLPGLFIAQIRQIRGETDRAIAEYKEFLKTHPGHAYTAFVNRQLLSLEMPQ